MGRLSGCYQDHRGLHSRKYLQSGFLFFLGTGLPFSANLPFGANLRLKIFCFS